METKKESKAVLIKKIAEKSKISQKICNEVLIAFVDVIVEEVRDENAQIAIPGLGTFKQKKQESRSARNPLTGEAVKTKASRTIVFKPQSSLKIFED